MSVPREPVERVVIFTRVRTMSVTTERIGQATTGEGSLVAVGDLTNPKDSHETANNRVITLRRGHN